MESSSNIILAPDVNRFTPNIDIEMNKSQLGNTTMNRSSMITYSKIVCCVCSASIDANSRGICEACEKKSIDISSGITKQAIIHYCKTCNRYLRPPWVNCELESKDMMSLCLSKIKGLNKAKIIDSSFVWTEPHSKTIKVKVTIQKDMEKTIVTSSFIVEYKVEWTQCDDCKKTFTPHIWNAAVQIRQKVNHKRTFLYLEQLILKHRAHAKALSIKEFSEGVDFYFSNKSQANTFIGFVESVLPIKTKQSRQLISHDQKSNIFNYKYTFMVEIAPICREDLIILDNDQYKKLGGIGPVLLCFKQTSRIHLIDPITFETFDIDSSIYWRYEFKSYIDRQCLTEFLIMSCEEEIDYNDKYKKEKKEKQQENLMDIDTTVNTDKNKSNLNRTENRIAKNMSKNDFKIVNVKCVRNSPNRKQNEVIEIRTHLGKNMRPGNVFYGYDLTEINLSEDLLQLIKNKMEKLPDVILVRKKYTSYKKIFKLKHLNMDVEEGEEDKKKVDKKALRKKEKEMEEFERDVGEIKDIRDKINLYADEEAINKLGEHLGNLEIANEDEQDSDIDIKVNELLKLEDLNIDDKNDDKYEEDDEAEFKNYGKEKKNETKNKNNNNKKLIGKRDRKGEHTDSEDEDNDN